MALQRKQISAENALMRLEDLCARSEHCEYELREKLRQWNVPAGDATGVLATLRKARFYDNRRFAEAFVRDKLIYNRWGKRKISLGLRAKRIDSDIIADALDTIDDEDYEEILHSLLTAKARAIKEGDKIEGRTKLYRFAITRGFESSLASKLIRQGLFPETGCGEG